MGCVMDLPRYCLCSFEDSTKSLRRVCFHAWCNVAQVVLWTFSVVGLAFVITLSLVLYLLGLGYIKRSALNLDHIFLS